MQTIAVNGTDLVYSDTGRVGASPVLLSHSLFFDHTMFDELSGLLVEAGYRVVSYDHRGQGVSAPATRAELSVDNLAVDAAALIEGLALGKVHVAGNSLGGFVALRLAARRPELLYSAAALGSSAEEEHSLAVFEPIVEELTANGASGLVPTLMHIMFGDDSLAQESVMTKRWAAFMADLGPSIGDCAYATIHRTRLVEELSGCPVPVLAVAGAQDHAYPPPISSVNIADATGGRSFAVEGAGHSVATENAPVVAEYLIAHFVAAEAR